MSISLDDGDEPVSPVGATGASGRELIVNGALAGDDPAALVAMASYW